MLQLPELSGNVLMEQILRLFDGDKNGYLSEKELIKAVQRLGELQQPDADPCQSEKRSLQLLKLTTPLNNYSICPVMACKCGTAGFTYYVISPLICTLCPALTVLPRLLIIRQAYSNTDTYS